MGNPNILAERVQPQQLALVIATSSALITIMILGHIICYIGYGVADPDRTDTWYLISVCVNSSVRKRTRHRCIGPRCSLRDADCRRLRRIPAAELAGPHCCSLRLSRASHNCENPPGLEHANPGDSIQGREIDTESDSAVHECHRAHTLDGFVGGELIVCISC